MGERKRVCCNCGNNIRTADDMGYITCHCQIDGHYISYVQCFEGWCSHWRKEKRHEED